MVDMNLDICLSESDCVIQTSLLNNFRFPKPFCNSGNGFLLPGDYQFLVYIYKKKSDLITSTLDIDLIYYVKHNFMVHCNIWATYFNWCELNSTQHYIDSIFSNCYFFNNFRLHIVHMAPRTSDRRCRWVAGRSCRRIVKTTRHREIPFE